MPYTYDYPRPAVGTDAILFAGTPGRLKVLLIKRKHEPYKDRWAFPGGFVDIDETIEHAVYRELEEETGITGVQLKRLDIFDAIDRDPRSRIMSVAHVGVTSEILPVQAQDDALEARWFDVSNLPPLAFDHDDMLQRALQTIQ